MRADIAIERDGPLHQAVKIYAQEHNVTHPRAYAELLEYGIDYVEECGSTPPTP